MKIGLKIYEDANYSLAPYVFNLELKL